VQLRRLCGRVTIICTPIRHELSCGAGHTRRSFSRSASCTFRTKSAIRSQPHVARSLFSTSRTSLEIVLNADVISWTVRLSFPFQPRPGSRSYIKRERVQERER
jgi:hypothetical protein